MSEIVTYYENLLLKNILYINEKDILCEEEWVAVNQYEDFYEISNLGRIKSKARYKGVTSDGETPRFYNAKILKQNFTKRGYLRIGLYDKNSKCRKYFLHVLVCNHFNGGQGNCTEVNHKNGIKICNIYNNVEWSTAKKNIEHAWSIGLCNNISENHHKAKLSNKQALEISKSELRGVELAKIYKVSKSVISGIRNGKRWATITGIKSSPYV